MKYGKFEIVRSFLFDGIYDIFDGDYLVGSIVGEMKFSEFVKFMEELVNER